MKIGMSSVLLIAVLALAVTTAYGQQPAEQCGPVASHFWDSLGMTVIYGCYIKAVLPGSLAYLEGLKPDDPAISLNGKKFRDFKSTLDFVLNTKAEAADTRAGVETLMHNPTGYGKKTRLATFRIDTSQLKEEKPIGFRCAPPAMITDVAEGTRASIAGAKPNWLILSINGQLIAELDNAIKVDQVMRNSIKSCKVDLVFGQWGDKETLLPNGTEQSNLLYVAGDNQGAGSENHELTTFWSAPVASTQLKGKAAAAIRDRPKGRECLQSALSHTRWFTQCLISDLNTVLNRSSARR